MSEGRSYTISKLAGEAGVPTSTVRYYERRGLLRPDRRSASNYRLYGPGALDRLRFMRSAQAAGFTLSDIGALLEFQDGGAAPCDEVQRLINARLDHVTEQLEHLRAVEPVLRSWLRVCRDMQKTGRCGVLERLGETNQQKRGKSRDCS